MRYIIRPLQTTSKQRLIDTKISLVGLFNRYGFTTNDENVGTYQVSLNFNGEIYSLFSLVIQYDLAESDFVIEHIEVKFVSNIPYFLQSENIYANLLNVLLDFLGGFRIYDTSSNSEQTVNSITDVEAKGTNLALNYKEYSKLMVEFREKALGFTSLNDSIHYAKEQYTPSFVTILYAMLSGMVDPGDKSAPSDLEMLIHEYLGSINQLSNLDEELKAILIRKSFYISSIAGSDLINIDFNFGTLFPMLLSNRLQSEEVQWMIHDLFMRVTNVGTYVTYQIQIDSIAEKIETIPNFLYIPEVSSRLYYCRVGSSDETIQVYLQHLDDPQYRQMRAKLHRNLEKGEDYTAIESYLKYSISYHYSKLSFAQKNKFRYRAFKYKVNLTGEYIPKRQQSPIVWWPIALFSFVFVGGQVWYLLSRYSSFATNASVLASKPEISQSTIVGVIFVYCMLYALIFVPVWLIFSRVIVPKIKSTASQIKQNALTAFTALWGIFIFIILFAVYFGVGQSIAWPSNSIRSVSTTTFQAERQMKYEDIKDASFDYVACGNSCGAITVSFIHQTQKQSIKDWDIVKQSTSTCKIYTIFEKKLREAKVKVTLSESYQKEVLQKICK